MGGGIVRLSQEWESECYADYNGNITTANLASNAGIVDTQLATITTAGKVNFSALVLSSQAQGDIIYASSSSVLTRLAAGTNGQILTTGGASANPSWAWMGSGTLLTSGGFSTVFSTTTPTANRTITVPDASINLGSQIIHAFANFDGTASGTISPRSSVGVSTVVKNGTGDYTITWSTPFSSANYVVLGIGGGAGNPENVEVIVDTATTAMATNLVRISTTNTANNRVDSAIVMVAALGS